MISLRSNLFKTRKPRQFSYLPRYYNERKERLDERKRLLEAESGNLNPADREARMRMAFSRGGTQRVHSPRSMKTGNTNRMILVIGFLVIGIYLIQKMGLWDHIF
jgi:hypothetical protein